MRTLVRSLAALASLAGALALLTACGTPATPFAGGAATATPNLLPPITPTPAMPLGGGPIPTLPGSLPAGYAPNAVPSAPAHPVYTGQPVAILTRPPPPPTMVVRQGPVGDTSATDAVLRQWQAAAQAIHSLHGQQRFMLVEPDGLRHPTSDDPRYGSVSTDEWYDGFGQQTTRGHGHLDLCRDASAGRGCGRELATYQVGGP